MTADRPLRDADKKRRGDDWDRKDVEDYDRRRAAEQDQAERDFQQGWRRQRYDETRENVTPWLLIRYRDTDLGARPIPPGEPFWISPDIWVESDDPLGRAVAGQANFVHARLFNVGAFAATPVSVDFYWANPAVGLGPGDMHLIGHAYVEVPSLFAVDVRCPTPWIPLLVNAGHECLMVNCSNHILDPILHPFQPTLDRHVGQRNITVISAESGQTVSVPLKVRNLQPWPAEVHLAAQLRHVAVPQRLVRGAAGDQQAREWPEVLAAAVSYGTPDPEAGEQLRNRYRTGTPEHRAAARLADAADRRRGLTDAMTGPMGQVRVVDRSTPRVAVHATSGVRIAGDRLAARFLGEQLIAEAVLLADADCSAHRGMQLMDEQLPGRGERDVLVELSVPEDAGPGELVVAHITQLTAGRLTGGYTVVAGVG